jgi:hypothetical protein
VYSQAPGVSALGVGRSGSMFPDRVPISAIPPRRVLVPSGWGGESRYGSRSTCGRGAIYLARSQGDAGVRGRKVSGKVTSAGFQSGHRNKSLRDSRWFAIPSKGEIRFSNFKNGHLSHKTAPTNTSAGAVVILLVGEDHSCLCGITTFSSRDLP